MTPFTTIGTTLAGFALAGTVTAGAVPATPVDGVWRTDGYGMVLVVEDGRARTFQTTAISCVEGFGVDQVGSPAADGTVRFGEGEISFTVRPARGRNRAVFHFAGSAGDWNLRRLTSPPARCTRPGAAGPLATFDVFWQTYAENYPFFARHGVDWKATRDAYRPRVRPDMGDGELFDLLVEMITPLHDAHTGIRAGERQYIGHRPGTVFPSEELEAKVRPFIERRDLRKPLTTWADGRIGYADLPGGIGYLRLIAFTGYTKEGSYEADAAEMDRALGAILTRDRTARLRGIVIDLRVNGGGADALGLRLASRLTAREYFAYAKHARNDAGDPTRFTRRQPISVTPDAPSYAGPVVILTGGSTISAGETFTQAMMERSPRPVRIGENTQGVFSDVLMRFLPNGWMFILPNEEFLTRSGETFDVTGIPPHVRTPVFTDEEFARNRDSAFDRAVSLLRR